jgi:hypothetical protein
MASKQVATSGVAGNAFSIVTDLSIGGVDGSTLPTILKTRGALSVTRAPFHLASLPICRVRGPHVQFRPHSADARNLVTSGVILWIPSMMRRIMDSDLG